MLTPMLMRSMYDREIGPKWMGRRARAGQLVRLPPKKNWKV